MAKCDFCGKDVKFGIKVSHSHRRSKRVYACTRCLRSGKVTRAN